MIPRVVALCLALACTAAAAEAQRTVNKRKMQDLVSTILDQRAGVRAKSVECPVGVPLGVGNRATCTAVGLDGSPFTVELIQTDDSGSVNFVIADERAVEVLEPHAATFYRQWKSGQLDEMYRDSHPAFQQAISAENLVRFLDCHAAELGGLVAPGDVQAAVMHRSDGSGQTLSMAEFGAGATEVKLSYMGGSDDWKLASIFIPTLEIDPAGLSPDPLIREVANLLAAVDAERWSDVYDSFSWELAGEKPLKQARRELADPSNLGLVREVKLTSFARNRFGLPVVGATAVRANGSQRVEFAFKTCGRDWKFRTYQLLTPDDERSTWSIENAQMMIIEALLEEDVEVSVRCPGTEIVLVPGFVYTCLATHPSGLTAPVDITVEDNGDVSWFLDGGEEWKPILGQD